MRKSLICLCVLLLLSLSVLAAGVNVMDDQKDEIVITEETLYGDPAAVDGLTVTTTLHHDYRLFWETSYEAGSDPQAATEFEFSTKQRFSITDADYGSFDLGFGSMNFGMGGDLNLEEMESRTGDNWQSHYDNMLLPAIDVASRTDPGETRTETLNLRDYYEYFRIGLNYHISGQNIDYWDDDQRQVYEDLNDYFRIPVPDELWVEVTLTKDMSGAVTDLDCWEVGSSAGASEMPADYEPWSVYTSSVCTPDGVFFTLGGNGDFSQVKGGFGLYHLPYGQKEERGYLDTARLENIYPMDRQTVGETFVLLSHDGTKLYLFTEETDSHYLTVLRCKDRAVEQRIRLGKLAVQPSVWMEDNVLALLSGDYETQEYVLQVLEHRDDRLSLWLETQMYPLNDGYVWYYRPEMLFDGERLVIGSFRDSWNRASHRILLFDQTGLQYAGDYTSTADLLPDRLRTDDVGGMKMEWTVGKDS